MDFGEGAIIQLLIQPTGDRGRKKGQDYVANKKKKEADPEKTTYSHDPKEMESITTKTEKSGFRTSLRIVVSAPNEQIANSHLSTLRRRMPNFLRPTTDFRQLKF
jgi:hypothetical protein